MNDAVSVFLTVAFNVTTPEYIPGFLVYAAGGALAVWRLMKRESE